MSKLFRLTFMFIFCTAFSNMVYCQAYYVIGERTLRTKKERHSKFHGGLVNFNYHKENSYMKLESDGTILCFEKVDRKRLSDDKRDHHTIYRTFDVDAGMRAYRTNGIKSPARFTRRTLKHPRRVALTHAFTTNAGILSKRYDVYQLLETDPAYDLQDNAKNVYDELALEISSAVASGKYTHVVIASTGWNNYPEKAMNTYNSWIRYIAQAAKADGAEFKPYFIGMTWPSLWQGAAFPFSIFNKANDADELGVGNINYLLWKAVMPAAKAGERKLPVVMIGHSLGARLVSRAAYSRKLLNTCPSNGNVDVLIALQGAFRINRFAGNGAGTDGCIYNIDDPVNKFIATTSKYDGAMSWGFWSTYIGHHKTPQHIGDVRYRQNFQTVTVNDQGIASSFGDGPYVIANADKMIWRIPPGGRGLEGAHSDMKDKEAGLFMWSFIKNFAGQ